MVRRKRFSVIVRQKSLLQNVNALPEKTIKIKKSGLRILFSLRKSSCWGWRSNVQHKRVNRQVSNVSWWWLFQLQFQSWASILATPIHSIDVLVEFSWKIVKNLRVERFFVGEWIKIAFHSNQFTNPGREDKNFYSFCILQHTQMHLSALAHRIFTEIRFSIIISNWIA